MKSTDPGKLHAMLPLLLHVGTLPITKESTTFVSVSTPSLIITRVRLLRYLAMDSNGKRIRWRSPQLMRRKTRPQLGAVGVSREKKPGEDAPIFVFYKPRKTYFDISFAPTSPAMTQDVKEGYRPRGIPISRYSAP